MGLLGCDTNNFSLLVPLSLVGEDQGFSGVVELRFCNLQKKRQQSCVGGTSEFTAHFSEIQTAISMLLGNLIFDPLNNKLLYYIDYQCRTQIHYRNEYIRNIL